MEKPYPNDPYYRYIYIYVYMYIIGIQLVTIGNYEIL